METVEPDVLTPEDITLLDIKDEEPTELDEKPTSPKKKSILLAIAVILFLIGYMLAPSPIQTGEFTISLEFESIDVNFGIEVQSTLPENVEKQILEYGSFVIQYDDIYSNQPGEIISFQLIPEEVIEELKTDQLVANLISDDAEYNMIGRIQEDGSILYEFKVLTDTNIAMGLLFAIAFMWLTEVIPLAASSLLIPVILAITRVQTATRALSYFAQPIIFLFLAGFLMAEAMQRTKLDKFISYRIFASIPPNGKLLLFSMMSLSAIFSMFMSNTAAVAILIPLAIQLLKSVDVGDNNYRKTMVLGIAYAATVGGIGSLIGTPPNIITAELLKEFNPEYQITFAQWFMFGLPVVFIMLPIVFIYLWTRFKPEISEDNLKKAQLQTKLIIAEELQLTRDQAIISTIFVVTFGLWLTTSFHGISTGIIALQAAVLLFMVGQLHESDLNLINWNALLTFGGGLTLGSVIIQTGLADYIGSYSIVLIGLPTIVILFTVALIGLILTAFASNTASAVILVPIVLPLGYILGISPIILAVVVAIAASIDFAIVIGTPPTMIAFSTGFFKVEEIFKIGIILDIIGLIVITAISTLLFGFFVTFL